MEVGRDFEYGGTVIRPPIDRVSSGKIFKPSAKLRNKYWFEAILTGIILWVVTIITFFGMMWLISGIDEGFPTWVILLDNFWEPVNFWFWIANLCWLVPTLILIPVYLNSFEYSVRANVQCRVSGNRRK